VKRWHTQLHVLSRSCQCVTALQSLLTSPCIFLQVNGILHAVRYPGTSMVTYWRAVPHINGRVAKNASASVSILANCWFYCSLRVPALVLRLPDLVNIIMAHKTSSPYSAHTQSDHGFIQIKTKKQLRMLSEKYEIHASSQATITPSLF
jgi:hypothetical protein